MTIIPARVSSPLGFSGRPHPPEGIAQGASRVGQSIKKLGKAKQTREGYLALGQTVLHLTRFSLSLLGQGIARCFGG